MKSKALTIAVIAVALVGAGLVWIFGWKNSSATQPGTITLDYAYYNPVSLLLKEKHFLEDDLAKDGVKVEWVHSLGSNKSLEMLNSKSIDFGSTAGVAAFLSKANGNPIKTIYVYSKPEWTALVVRKDSPINSVADLKGKKVAVTRGTDPHVFLLRALDQVGLSEKDIEVIPLQHPDGKNALEKGDVEAWAGLDPLMATTEVDQGFRLFYRNPDFNTYGVLNVRQEFATKYPSHVARVLAAYEQARKYALAHPDELRQILARDAKLNDAVSVRVLERTDLSNPVIGETQKTAILAAAGVLKKSGVIKADTDAQAVVNDLIDPQYSKDLKP
jgi:sulfonate transport system substrate-binding protein